MLYLPFIFIINTPIILILLLIDSSNHQCLLLRWSYHVHDTENRQNGFPLSITLCFEIRVRTSQVLTSMFPKVIVFTSVDIIERSCLCLTSESVIKPPSAISFLFLFWCRILLGFGWLSWVSVKDLFFFTRGQVMSWFSLAFLM